MPRQQFDVFLSYSRADSARVMALRDELQKLGYRVFFDVDSIDPATNWKKRLETAIGASRTLVLCWSEHTRGSEYIAYEYQRADALHKTVYPWKLDHAPLPSMIADRNAITLQDPVEVAARLKPFVGRPLAARRRLQMALAAMFAVVLGVGLWWKLKPPPPPPPPPPWNYIVTVSETGGSQLPLSGVVVTLKPSADSATTIATKTTDALGRAEFLHLAPPRPDFVYVMLRAPGYEGDAALKRTDTPFVADLMKLK